MTDANPRHVPPAGVPGKVAVATATLAEARATATTAITAAHHDLTRALAEHAEVTAVMAERAENLSYPPTGNRFMLSAGAILGAEGALRQAISTAVSLGLTEDRVAAARSRQPV